MEQAGGTGELVNAPGKFLEGAKRKKKKKKGKEKISKNLKYRTLQAVKLGLL